MSTYRKAADVLDGDEKQIERAWNEWGDSLTLGVRRARAAQDGKIAELRAHIAAEAAAAAEQFPHMAALFMAPEAIDTHVEKIREHAIKMAGDIDALVRLPSLPDIN